MANFLSFYPYFFRDKESNYRYWFTGGRGIGYLNTAKVVRKIFRRYMIIIIDGYNVLKQAFNPKSIAENQRTDFVKVLQTYASAKKHKIVLVFDAGPFDFPTKEPFGQVLVLYAGAGRSADDLIKEYITKNREKDLFLVTSDRALRSFAQRLQVESIPAMDFYVSLQTGKRADHKKIADHEETIVKMTQHENDELDDLMAQTDVHTKSDDATMNRKSSAQTLSKKERKIMQKIKKL